MILLEILSLQYFLYKTLEKGGELFSKEVLHLIIAS